LTGSFALALLSLVLALGAVGWAYLGYRRLRRERNRLLEVEQTLRHDAARLRVMLEQLPAVVWTTDDNLEFTSSQGAALTGLGLQPNQAVGQSIFEYFGTDDEDFPAIKAHRRALGGESLAFELDWSGQSFHSLVEPLRQSDGTIVGAVGVALDVTEVRTSEAALRASEERYRDFLTHSSEGIWRLELDEPMPVSLPVDEQLEFLYEHGRFAECNSALSFMVGLESPSQLVGATLERLLSHDDPQVLEHLSVFVKSDYDLEEAEIEELDRRGRARFHQINLTGILEDRFLVRVWGTHRDITDHRRAQQALRASEERYREIFEGSLDTLFISTPEGHLLDINPAGLRLLGYDSKDELLQVDIEELYVDPDVRQSGLDRLAKEEFLRDFELRLRRKDGSQVAVLETTTAVKGESGELFALRGMLRDVTDQRALEEQLLRSQRMEAVGRLAGGVAHDFNNLLTVINGRSDLLRSQLDPGSPLVAEVDEIKAAGERAAALTRQLLVLSRRRTSSPQAINLNGLVKSMENLLRRSIGERIELVAHFDPDLANIKADPGQIEQVILNLALNARDAMPRGGRLVIDTTNVSVTPGSALALYGLAPGPYVFLRFEDTGTGIDPGIRGQIFEPFFSTKDPAEGTGLGLATVYGIVQQSNGHVRVESEPGRGACFEVYFPAVSDPVESTRKQVAVPSSPSGSETVLLVEDEAAVRGLLRRFMDGKGYRVLEAADGEEALSVVENEAGRIDLLLTDLVMPGMGGFELAHRLEAKLPDVKILFMSGYSEGAEAFFNSGLVSDAKNFLQKPFSTDLLAQRLREVLDSG
jgi:PAS domain S-box-containing protein